MSACSLTPVTLPGQSGQLASSLHECRRANELLSVSSLITLSWMLIECVVALISSRKAHSPALFAFGSDSAVELLSAMVVLLQFMPSFRLSQARATQCAGILLFFLAGIVAFTSVGALILRVEPDTSWVGVGVTVAALLQRELSPLPGQS